VGHGGGARQQHLREIDRLAQVDRHASPPSPQSACTAAG
jgi:hypothetical protein